MSAAELLRQASAIYADTGLTPDDLAKRVEELKARLTSIADTCRIVYKAVPSLPVETQTMEAATNALHAFCLMLGCEGIDISDEAIARAESGHG